MILHSIQMTLAMIFIFISLFLSTTHSTFFCWVRLFSKKAVWAMVHRADLKRLRTSNLLRHALVETPLANSEERKPACWRRLQPLKEFLI